MWRELQSAAPKDLKLPEVIDGRCVHALMETASCRACADACPRDAWVIDDELLGIDRDRCDGCDLCVPACPQGAIAGRFSASLKTIDQGGAAFAACEHADVRTGSDGLMPCLHTLGMSDLLQLRRDGAVFLVTSRGDCDDCNRGGAKRLDQRLDEANLLLASRGLEPLKYRNLAADAWDRTFRHFHELSASRPLNRRAFFRNSVKLPKERVEAAIEDVIGAFVPPGMLLEGGDADALFPYVPRIDPGLCVGCDACVRLCPQQAIELYTEAPDDLLFLIHAERCSGCGICTDVCERDAVLVHPMGQEQETRIPLHERRCPACGAQFHASTTGAQAARLCWVCLRTERHRTLYQVLD